MNRPQTTVHRERSEAKPCEASPSGDPRLRSAPDRGRGPQTGKKKIPALKFDEKGLIPSIIQDYKSSDVLMVAYMNREALKITLREKRTCFYSRSRKVLWRKGSSSGHIQKVKQIYYDCDKDALLIKVEQTGAACHTGEWSCFYRRII